MCVTCGCGQGAETRIEGDAAAGEHVHLPPDGTRVVHRHAHEHEKQSRTPESDPVFHDAHHQHGHGDGHHVHAHAHERAQRATELVHLERSLLDKNQRIAERNRGWLLLTKIDLLPYVRFDPARAEANARTINPHVRALRVSAETGDGLAEWYGRLRALRLPAAERSA